MPLSTTTPPRFRPVSQSVSNEVLDNSMQIGDRMRVVGNGLCQVIRFSGWGRLPHMEHYVHMMNCTTGKPVSFRIYNV